MNTDIQNSITHDKNLCNNSNFIIFQLQKESMKKKLNADRNKTKNNKYQEKIPENHTQYKSMCFSFSFHTQCMMELSILSENSWTKSMFESRQIHIFEPRNDA